MKRPKYKEQYIEAQEVLDSVLDTLQNAILLKNLSSKKHGAKLLEQRVELAIMQIELFQNKEEDEN